MALEEQNINGWNESNVNILKNMQKEIEDFAWKHEQSHYYYSRIDKIMGITGTFIVLSGSCSAVLILILGYYYATLVINCITLFGGILKGLQDYLILGKKTQWHRNYKDKYKDFYYELAMLIAKNVKDRENADDTIIFVRKRFRELLTKSPEIPSIIDKRYNYYKKNGYLSCIYYII